MKDLTIYLLETLACSGALLAAYTVLLERRTKFLVCRLYLIGAVPLAAAIPLLRIPVWPAATVTAAGPVAVSAADATAEILETTTFDPFSLALAVWLFGTLFSLGLLAWQSIRILRLRRGAEIDFADGICIVRTPYPAASFSFFRTIYVSRDLSKEDFPAILAHEASHIRHRHSAERMGMECIKALMWWNPFVWIAARRLAEVQEYEADDDVIRRGYDVPAYIQTIFRQLFGFSPDIANGLRNSLTKKRFKMMKTSRKSRCSLLRIAGLVPVVAGLLAAFSFTAKATQYRTEVPSGAPAASAVPAVNEELPETGPAFAPQKKEEPQKTVPVRTITLKGRVTTDKGEPAAGAVIVVKESGKTYDDPPYAETRADDQGRYSLPAPAQGYLICTDNTGKISTVKTYRPTDESAGTLEKDIVLKSAEPVVGESDKTEFFLKAEKMPSFEGGDLSAFREWVNKQLRYPAIAFQERRSGRVIARFIVEVDGSVGSVRILQSPGDDFSAEVRRVLESSPRWTPGVQDGKTVRVIFTLPIDFTITGDHSEDTTSTASADVQNKEERSSNEAPSAGNLQEDKTGPEVSMTVLPEEMPRFKGGRLSDFRQWLMTQVHYPQKAFEEGRTGRVVAQFVVRNDGSVSDIRILQSPGDDFSAEVRRLLENSPRWTPGVLKGKAVHVKYTLPIDFNIQTDAEDTKTIEPISVMAFDTQKR